MCVSHELQYFRQFSMMCLRRRFGCVDAAEVLGVRARVDRSYINLVGLDAGEVTRVRALVERSNRFKRQLKERRKIKIILI